MPAFIDRTGMRYGRWVLTTYQGNSKWLAHCDCGAYSVVAGRDVVSGKSSSCGCFREEMAGTIRRTHGKSESKAYAIWLHMKGRCYNPSNIRYKLYGGRGITVCDRWHTFENFYADMGDPPDGMSIDRIDNNLGYAPSNCRWATQKEQVHNSRSTKLSDDDVRAVRADSRPLKVIAAEYGVGHTYICNLRAGRIRPL
jgi:hypothetical protein